LGGNEREITVFGKELVQKWNTKSFILKKPQNVIKINFSEIAEK
jgi:hypothetical protein